MSKLEVRVHEGFNHLELSQNLNLAAEKRDIYKTGIKN